LQRLGLVERETRKGKRVSYRRSEILPWLLALVMQQAGWDPSVVVAALKHCWKDIAGSIEQAAAWDARSGGAQAYLVVRPRVMTAAFEQTPGLTIDVLFLDPARASNPLLPSPHGQLLQVLDAHRDDWFCAYNLTRILSRLDAAL
jgi:hypothetical protein